MSKAEKESPATDKRRSILDAAGRLFMEQGFSAVSMDAIAEAAPVSKPTLYNHFKDKKEMFATVVSERCRVLFEGMEKGLQRGDDAKTTLSTIGDRFLTLVLSEEAISMHRVVIGESRLFPELGTLFYECGPKRAGELLGGFLAMLHQTGRLQVPDAQASARLFFSMLKGNAHMQCLLGMRHGVTPSERKAIVEHAVDVFLKGHAPA